MDKNAVLNALCVVFDWIQAEVRLALGKDNLDSKQMAVFNARWHGAVVLARTLLPSEKDGDDIDALIDVLGPVL